MSLGRAEARSILKGLLIILSGALMILPAYLNLVIFTKLQFELTVSLSISLMMFAIGVLVFILSVGTEAFEGKR